MDGPIRIAIVDDNAQLREQLSQNLGAFPQLELLFAAGNGEEALAALASCARLPQVMLMDLEMPLMDGVEATRQITGATDIRVLILTVFDSDEKIFEAICAGAAGYLLKDSRPDHILTAITDVLNGGAAISPHIAWRMLSLLRDRSGGAASLPAPSDYNLSAREAELLQLLVAGHSYKQIAARMNISHGTVRKHIENIYGKLHIHSKVEAVHTAHRFQWFRPS